MTPEGGVAASESCGRSSVLRQSGRGLHARIGDRDAHNQSDIIPLETTSDMQQQYAAQKILSPLVYLSSCGKAGAGVNTDKVKCNAPHTIGMSAGSTCVCQLISLGAKFRQSLRAYRMSNALMLVRSHRLDRICSSP